MSDTLIFLDPSVSGVNQIAKILTPFPCSEIPDARLEKGLYYLPDCDDAFLKTIVTRPGVRIVAFCQEPAEFLASKFEKCAELDLNECLLKWCESAEALLSNWRKNRTRFHFLNSAECSAFPNDFTEWVHKVSALNLEWCGEHPAQESDLIRNLCYWVCGSLVKEHRRARRLWQEILAACEPLASGFEAESSFPEAFEAIQGLVQLEAAQTAIREERDALNTRCSSLAAERAAIAARLSTLEAQRAADVAEITVERDELATRNKSLVTEREAISADLQKQKEEALQTHEMLLSEIHNAHIESEGFFEEWKTLEASTNFHHLRIGSVSRGKESNSPTHSHLDFSFERLELFERSWPRLAVRLVEHNGNAGLAIFDFPANKERPLFHWKPTGEEGGIDYMLFVPTDKSASEILVALPATDLILLRCLTARILGHLSVHGDAPTGRWSVVARRLLQQIEEIPERLHYDSIVARPVHGSKGKAIDFAANHLFFRGSVAESFRWTWYPGAKGGEIILRKTDGSAHLLFSWPAEQESLCIVMDGPEALKRNRSVWHQLLERDREFLRLLVTALPDFIFHLCEQHPDQAKAQRDLKSQAKILRCEMNKLSSPKTPWNLLTKIFAR